MRVFLMCLPTIAAKPLPRCTDSLAATSLDLMLYRATISRLTCVCPCLAIFDKPRPTALFIAAGDNSADIFAFILRIALSFILSVGMALL
jgi:hypothetical protein